MSAWKVPLPRVAPKDGHHHVVYAHGTLGGARVEYRGEITKDQAAQILAILIPKAKDSK
jgi:hypothetical protein